MAIRILLVDYHSVVRQGLRLFLKYDPELEIVGETADGAQALRLARELKPDVVLMDLLMPVMDGIAATAAIRRELPETEVLDYILSLAEAALAEMRALIFKLRPESLESEGVVAALSKQAAAVQARHGIAVAIDLCYEPELPMHVRQELYRVAQEAMHNTVKHAHANKIDLRLEQSAKGITLEIRDDGAGFDPTASYPGHLGLHSMSERVAKLDGMFQIESTPGVGTRVCVHIPGYAL